MLCLSSSEGSFLIKLLFKVVWHACRYWMFGNSPGEAKKKDGGFENLSKSWTTALWKIVRILKETYFHLTFSLNNLLLVVAVVKKEIINKIAMTRKKNI